MNPIYNSQLRSPQITQLTVSVGNGANENISNNQNAIDERQKEIDALKAEVQKLKDQLEDVHKRKVDDDLKGLTKKLNIAEKNKSFDSEFPQFRYPVNVNFNGILQTVPLAILQVSPIYSTLEKFSDSKELIIDIKQKISSEAIASFFQFLKMQFHAKHLKEACTSFEKLCENPEEENLTQFLALTDRFCFNDEETIEFLKKSVKTALLKDQTGQLLIRYIEICKLPNFSWLCDVIRSAIIQISSENRDMDHILRINQHLFSYIRNHQSFKNKERQLLAQCLFQLFPHHLEKDVFLFDFAANFCSAWVCLYQYLLPRNQVFFDVLMELPKPTLETNIVRLFSDYYRRFSREIKEFFPANNTPASVDFYSAIDLLRNYCDNRDVRMLGMASVCFTSAVSKDSNYIIPILEIFKNPLHPKFDNNFIYTFSFKPQEAVEFLSPLIEYVPNNFKLLSKLASLYSQANKLQETLDLYYRALMIKQSPEIVHEYLKCLIKEKKDIENHYKKAADIIEKVIEKLDPRDFSNFTFFHYSSASLNFALGNVEKALCEIMKAKDFLAKSPDESAGSSINQLHELIQKALLNK